MPREVSAAILAGGLGRRMGGIAKGLIPVEGKPIILRTAELVAPLVDETIVISNSPASYQFLRLPIFPDDELGLGPLQGIVTALRKVASRRLLVLPCDMPFVTRSAIRTLLSYMPEADAVIPMSRKGQEPLFAVYSKACLAPAARALSRGMRRIVEFFPEVHAVSVPCDEFDESIWFNINHHADLRTLHARSQNSL